MADLMTPYIDPMFDKLFGIERAKSDVYSGQVIRTEEDIDYLNQRDGTNSQGNDGDKAYNPVDRPEAERDGDNRNELVMPSRKEPENQRTERLFGGRTAVDSMPPLSGSTPEEDRQASAEALAGVLTRTPINVKNQLGITLELDGQALETKISQVNERQNYETLGDLKTTTER